MNMYKCKNGNYVSYSDLENCCYVFNCSIEEILSKVELIYVTNVIDMIKHGTVAKAVLLYRQIHPTASLHDSYEMVKKIKNDLTV